MGRTYSQSMRIAIAGGGPGGLYLSILFKRLDPAHEVVVYERNAPDDTFGFGVVFSDETLAAFEAADPETLRRDHAALRALERDRRPLPRRGHHQRRPRLLGARAQATCSTSCRPAPPASASTCASAPRRRQLEADLIVAADGVNSALRARYADTFKPTLDRRKATYAWFGTEHVFDAFTFLIAETDARRRPGPRLSLQRHDEHVHRRDRPSDARAATRRPAEALFGYRLIENRTRWINFVTVRNAALAPRERRPARRRRAHRALLDRLGHQARDGGRDLARVGGQGRTTSTPTRPSAARSSRARSARRRARSSGSRGSAATPSRTRARSRSTC